EQYSGDTDLSLQTFTQSELEAHDFGGDAPNFIRVDGTVYANEGSAPSGTELLVNGTFDTNTDWTKGDGVTISGGTLNLNTDGNQGAHQTPFGTTNGKWLYASYDVLNYVSGNAQMRLL